MPQLFQYNDGGRSAAGFKGKSGDCGVRAMAIACEIPYKEARARCKEASAVGRMGSKSIARGIYKEDMTAALAKLGWVWRSAPKIEGRKARCSDMPKGRVIARMSHHFVAVIDGVAHDSFDSTNKMVYGYWQHA
jgi:hypothetical protein